MLQKIYISNKCCSFELSIQRILKKNIMEAAQAFKKKKKKILLTTNFWMLVCMFYLHNTSNN